MLHHVTMGATLATAYVILLGGCTQQQHTQDASRLTSTIDRLAVHRERLDPAVESQARGRKVYEQYCQICHGKGLQGNGFNAAMLNPAPRNFADETFWKGVDDSQLQKVIAQGGKSIGKSVLMPAWGRTLNVGQIHDVISFLRTAPLQAKQAAEADASDSAESESSDQ